jgi:hypothetical protein
MTNMAKSIEEIGTRMELLAVLSSDAAYRGRLFVGARGLYACTRGSALAIMAGLGQAVLWASGVFGDLVPEPIGLGFTVSLAIVMLTTTAALYVFAPFPHRNDREYFSARLDRFAEKFTPLDPDAFALVKVELKVYAPARAFYMWSRSEFRATEEAVGQFANPTQMTSTEHM